VFEEAVMRTAMLDTALGSALALTLAAGGAVAAAQAPATERPKIEGAWTLNRDIGDRPGRSAGMPDDQGGGGHRRGGYGGGGGGGYGGGMGGMRGGGMGGGGQMSDEQRAEMQRRRNLARELLTPPTRLNITVDGDIVTFTDADGRVKKYKTDGKKEKHQFDNGTVDTKSKWEKEQLTIETSTSGGMKLVETYSVNDRHQLVVEARFDGGRGGDRPPIVHVYDDASIPQ
jgi:hypothetical protein